MNTTVYSSGPSCMKCRLTHRAMDNDQHLVPHEYVILEDMSEAPAHVQHLIATGQWTQYTPFVVTVDDSGEIVPEHTWNDYRPDKIKALAAHLIPA